MRVVALAGYVDDRAEALDAGAQRDERFEEMGTSDHMIETHYGHVNTIKHADRVLQGMAGWELPQPEETKARAPKAAETHDKSKRGQRHKPR